MVILSNKEGGMYTEDVFLHGVSDMLDGQLEVNCLIGGPGYRARSLHDLGSL